MPSICLIGQRSNDARLDSVTIRLFKEGINLGEIKVSIQNSNIPWDTPLNGVKDYGNQKVKKRLNNMTFRWDSVKLFNGITATLLSPSSRVLTSGGYAKFRYASIILDSVNVKIAMQFIETYFGHPRKIRRGRKGTFTEAIWTINNYYVGLSKWSNYPNINRITLSKFR